MDLEQGVSAMRRIPFDVIIPSEQETSLRFLARVEDEKGSCFVPIRECQGHYCNVSTATRAPGQGWEGIGTGFNSYYLLEIFSQEKTVHAKIGSYVHKEGAMDLKQRVFHFEFRFGHA